MSDNDGKSKNGCFIATFIFIAIGIPITLKDESLVHSFGVIPLVIGGLLLAYFVAKALSGKDE
ncbi:MAG: hypothetical protein M0P26_05375 [Bacteroidales bacterium]|nr:hypothetical protein [Bacteroidales bacterium]